MPAEMMCAKCAVSDDTKPLKKCPICYKMVCEDCRYQVSGRSFCSSGCAQYFFFEDPEEDL